MAKKEIDTAAYVDKYSDEGLMSKVKLLGKKMGGKLLYNVISVPLKSGRVKY
jgi:hypothetical protein